MGFEARGKLRCGRGAASQGRGSRVDQSAVEGDGELASLEVMASSFQSSPSFPLSLQAAGLFIRGWARSPWNQS